MMIKNVVLATAVCAATLAAAAPALADPFTEGADLKITSHGAGPSDPRNCLAAEKSTVGGTEHYNLVPRPCNAKDQRQKWRWDKATGHLTPLSHPKRCATSKNLRPDMDTRSLELMLCSPDMKDRQSWEHGMGNRNGDLIYGPEYTQAAQPAAGGGGGPSFGGRPARTVRDHLSCAFDTKAASICNVIQHDNNPQDRFRITTW
ncbi:hypothetical protein [Streptomyces sp. NBC_00083]|uniref:hypothetical protein n=1 Tax=Streptomyces sp. NBC_00083 TaxID=2975647 RepID=UPI00225286D0|nr:hypothetical protein [Streptomyces sp. NBC_00083]MCX5384847.1 hypothetical protein [Streptomyces sp. NBC_00083]